jgi:hypothetical protein
VRIGKIARIIRECQWGIHDISRTEPNPSGLPRFNMPLERGIFLGARWFRDRPQKRKSCLIRDVYRIATSSTRAKVMSWGIWKLRLTFGRGSTTF